MRKLMKAMVNSKDDVDYWDAALELIAGEQGYKLDLESLITKRLSLPEAVEVFEKYDREKWIKIIEEPWRE